MLNFADFLAVFGCHDLDVWEEGLHLWAALKRGWLTVNNLQQELFYTCIILRIDSVSLEGPYFVRERWNMAPGATDETDPLLSWKKRKYQLRFPTQVQNSKHWVSTVCKH